MRPNRPQNRSEQLADRQNAQQDVFLREVDDALREEELFTMAKRYGRPIAAAVVAGLLALAGYLWWQYSTTQAAAARGEQIVTALDKFDAGSPDAASQQLAPLAKDGPAGSRAVAAMIRASITAQQGKADEAAKGFNAIAADAGAPQPLRDLATIRAVSLKFDSMPAQDVVTRLKPLAVPGNPWFGSAGELLGMAYLKQGKPDLAGPLFATIARDKDVPETLRSRMRQLAGQFGIDAVGDVTKLVNPGGPVAPAAQPAAK